MDLQTLKSFLRAHREWFLLPIFSAAMLLAIQGVWLLTGRAPTDDPGELVGACYRAIRLAIVIAMTGYVQDHHFGYRSRGPNARLRDDIYDACTTLSLLWLFSRLLWH